jgi:glycosyltransferase involved in cell wall biosynthesis
LTRFLRREAIDLVITYSGKDAWLGLLAGRLGGVPGLRMKNLELFTHKTSYNLSQRVVVPSAHLRDFLVRNGVRTERIEILHPGIDTERFHPDPRAGAQTRARHGLGSDAVVLTYVAHFREPKNQMSLVRALARIVDPRVRLLLVGDTEGDYYRQVRAEITRLGVQGRVICTGRTAAVEPYLQASDLFLFPSVQEAMPRAVMEALACGLYVVAADIPALREILREPYLGRLFDPARLEALAPILVRALEDPAALALQRERRHAYVREHFDAAGMVRGFERICRQTLAGG